MVDNNKWYVLQVQTGSEIDVQKELLRRGVKAVVPIENRQIHNKKEWISKQYVVFAGYVFIKVMYSWSQYYILSGINGVIRLLGGGNHPEPLSKQETNWILNLTDMLREPSVIRFNADNSYEIVSGVLRDMQDSIIKIERHYRRVTVKLKLAGQEHNIKLSYVTQTLDNKEN